MSELFGTSQTHLTYLESGTRIHKDVLTPWLKLKEAASKDKIDIEIASCYRDFDRQQHIWDRKFNGELKIKDDLGNVIEPSSLDEQGLIKAIMRFSALPGTSRHHWGTDMDVYSPSLLKGQKLQLEPWEYEHEGPLARLTHWLDNNMRDFGFYRPYDKDRGGVAIEPWHLSHDETSTKYSGELDVPSLESFLNSSNILGKATVLNSIDYLYNQYVINVGHFND